MPILQTRTRPEFENDVFWNPNPTQIRIQEKLKPKPDPKSKIFMFPNPNPKNFEPDHALLARPFRWLDTYLQISNLKLRSIF